MRKNEEIDQAFCNFFRKTILLMEESKATLDNKKSQATPIISELENFEISSSMTDEQFKEAREGNDELYKLHQGIELALNSNFIYCLSLFEIFISQIVRISFQNYKAPKRRYIQKFENHALLVNRQEKNEEFIKMLKSPKAMIAHYDDLPDPLGICFHMFDIETKGINKRYEPRNFRYIEARERRNLLVHRGTYSDDRYIETIVRKFSNRKKHIKDFINHTHSRFAINRKNPKDLSVSLDYLGNACESLLYISSLVYFSFTQSKEVIFAQGISHGYLLKKLSIFPHLSTVLRDVVLSYKQMVGKGKWENVPAIDKINLLLAQRFYQDWGLSRLDRLEEAANFLRQNSRGASGKNNRDALDKQLNRLDKQLNRIYKGRDKLMEEYKVFEEQRNNMISMLPDDFELRGKLLKSALDENTRDLIKYAKQMFDKGELGKDDLARWFVFEKYQDNKEFQTFVSTL